MRGPAQAGPADRDFAALPALPLHPLPPPAAAAFLDDVTGGAVDPALRDELLEEAEGNPALLLAMVRRLTPAQLSGERRPPRPLADARVLAGVTGEWPTAPTPAADDLLLLTAAATRDEEHTEAGAALVHAAWRRLVAGSGLPPPPDAHPDVLSDDLPGAHPDVLSDDLPDDLLNTLPDVLVRTEGRLRFTGPLSRRAVYARAAPDRRHAAHRALAHVLRAQGQELPALLHTAWATTAPAPPGRRNWRRPRRPCPRTGCARRPSPAPRN
ncbi:hypothetical protein SGLAM104S_02613 [Streptomyces glaucescens]